MIGSIAHALLPILFVVSLGYLAAITKALPSEASGTLAVFVLKFALPVSLFLAAAQTRPEDLTNLRFFLSFLIGMIASFIIGVLASRVLFRRTPPEMGLAGLTAAMPNMAYCGPPVLAAVVGQGGLLAVLIGNLIATIFILPLTLVLMHHKAGGNGSGTGLTKELWSSVLSSARQPLVILPVGGAVLSLLHITLPEIAKLMASQIGTAAGGVALFTLGLMLAGQTLRLDREEITNVGLKNLLQPVLLLATGFALGLRGDLLKEVFLIGVLPSATLIPSLAHAGKVYEDQAAVSVMGSTLFSVVTIAVGIAVAKTLL